MQRKCTDAAHQCTERVVSQPCMSINVANVWIGLKPMCPTGSIMFRTRTGMSTEFLQVEEYLFYTAFSLKEGMCETKCSKVRMFTLRLIWHPRYRGKEFWRCSCHTHSSTGYVEIALLARHATPVEHKNEKVPIQFRKYQCPTFRAG